MSLEVRMIPVYHANQSGRGRAAFFVSYDAAREMVEGFFARWDKKARHITLLTTVAEMHRSALSLTMGPAVIEACAMGSLPHLALLAGWEQRAA